MPHKTSYDELGPFRASYLGAPKTHNESRMVRMADDEQEYVWQIGERAEYTDESLQGVVADVFFEDGLQFVAFQTGRGTFKVGANHLIPASVFVTVRMAAEAAAKLAEACQWASSRATDELDREDLTEAKRSLIEAHYEWLSWGARWLVNEEARS